MSLNVYLEKLQPCSVFAANITHNLGKMADAAGIYYACWKPEAIGAKLASDILPTLEAGLAKMKADPAYFRQFDAPNGWGTYENFIAWVEMYIKACKENPDATIRVSR